MAVKIFGTCSGNSGGKYNLWLEVTENSHSTKNNASNITVNLKLKRNDGYSNSAYNLNKSDNFAKITINGSVKASGNLVIDTRSSAVVVLSSWTGNVLHDATGKLKITVGGSFTMNGTSLSGGTVSGEFNCVTIPRTTPFTLNKTNVNCGESVSLTLTPYSKEFTHIIVYTLNDASASVSIPKGTTQVELLIPEEWAGQLTKTNQSSIKFELKTYNQSSLIGTQTKNIKFTIPATDNFLPQFNIQTIPNKNGLVPMIWDAIVQNKSTLTVKLNSFEGKYGSTYSSSYFIVCGKKKYGESAEFDLTESGFVKIKTRVVDSRGLYRDEECYVEVASYSIPTIVCNDIFRCDSDGTPNENGTNVVIDFTKTYSSIFDLNMGYAKVKFKKYNQTEYSELVQLTKSPFILTHSFEKESSYDFVLQINDLITVTPIEIKYVLPSAGIAFNIKKGGKGAAFGCYAETEKELTVGYDLNVKGLLKCTSLNSDIVPTGNIQILSCDVRKYECMKMIVMNVRFKLLGDLTAGSLTELFSINNFKLPNTYSLPIHYDGYLTSHGVIYSYINALGIVKILSTPSLNKGGTLNINAVFCYS